MSASKLIYIRRVLTAKQQPPIDEINAKISIFTNTDYTRWDTHTNDTDGKDLWNKYVNSCTDSDTYTPILYAVQSLDFEDLRGLLYPEGLDPLPLPECIQWLAWYDQLMASDYFDL